MTATQTNLRCFGVEYLLKDWVLLERLYIGASPSGKATDFDSVIPMVRVHPPQPKGAYSNLLEWLVNPLFMRLVSPRQCALSGANTFTSLQESRRFLMACHPCIELNGRAAGSGARRYRFDSCCTDQHLQEWYITVRCAVHLCALCAKVLFLLIFQDRRLLSYNFPRRF